jgi:alpha-methylacyl-CoA racemase
MAEAPQHPHMQARGNFFDQGGLVQPAPAPRFSRTRPELPRPPAHPAADTEAGLRAFGLDDSRIAELRAAGAIA